MKHDEPLEYSHASYFVIVHELDSELVHRRAVLKLSSIRFVLVLKLSRVHETARARRRCGGQRETRA